MCETSVLFLQSWGKCPTTPSDAQVTAEWSTFVGRTLFVPPSMAAVTLYPFFRWRIHVYFITTWATHCTGIFCVLVRLFWLSADYWRVFLLRHQIFSWSSAISAYLFLFTLLFLLLAVSCLQLLGCKNTICLVTVTSVTHLWLKFTNLGALTNILHYIT